MFPIALTEEQFIELEANTPEGHAHYLSQILALAPSEIQVSYPCSLNQHRAQIDAGMALRAGVITETGTYGFRTSVIQVIESSPPSLTLATPEEVYEWQRRYFRLDSAIWVRYRTIPSLELAGCHEPSRRAFTTTVNIGGGGLLLKAGDELPLGSLLEMEIELPTSEDPILALGRVVHGYGGRGIEFLLIEETDRDAIIRSIFRSIRRAHPAVTGDSSIQREERS